jgi:DNA-binding CsgD family transcriptional regulator
VTRAVVLTASDRAALGKVQRHLLSPLDYPTTDAWYREASRELKRLLGADKCVLYLPDERPSDSHDAGCGGRVRCYSEEYALHDLCAYPGGVAPFAARVRLWERMAALGAHERDELYREVLTEFYRSAYYNEWIRGMRAFDAVGLTAVVDPSRPPAFETEAQLLLHHERERGPRFGPRGRALLDLVLPAFRAAVDAERRLRAVRAELGSLLDATGQALVVCGATGCVVHQTPAFSALLAGEPAGALALRAAVTAICRALGQPAAGPAARLVDGAATAYALSGTHVTGTLAAGQPGGRAVLVTVTRVGPPALPETERLCERFGLTPAQARVARLLGEGRADKDIGAALGISVHTARRHAEAVLAKLGVNRRGQVAAALHAATSAKQ